MPFEVRYNNRFIETRISGTTNIDDLLAIARKIASLESTLPVTPHRVADISELTNADLDIHEMDEFAAMRRTAVVKNPVRSAIIAPSALQFGVARMFQTLNNNPDISVEIFRDAESAYSWLEQA